MTLPPNPLAPRRLAGRIALGLALLAIGGAARADLGGCAREGVAEALDPRTAELRAEWTDLKAELGLPWAKWIDDDTDFTRFVNGVDLERARAQGIHPVELYGAANYQAWRRGDDFLNQIPLGRLELSMELFEELHRQAQAKPTGIVDRLVQHLPSGYFNGQRGALKKSRNAAWEPLWMPLSDEQVAEIRANSGLSGFRELPYPLSLPGKRRGWILYAGGAELRGKLDDLITWYNANRETMDAVELAATFQRRFISLHPFRDGNGRISRLLMERILRERGLPPPVLRDHWQDLFLNEAGWTAYVRDGVALTLETLRDPTVRQTMAPAPATPSPVGGDLFATGAGLAEEIARPHVFGGQEFKLGADGFFRSPRGVPYAVTEGKLVPVADATYALYFAGAEHRAPPRGRSAPAKNAPPLRTGRMLARQYADALELIRLVREGKVESSRVEVVPYQRIDAANRANRIQLEPGQKELLREALTVPDDLAPEQILAFGGFARTEFSEAVHQSKAVNPSPATTLAQYELMDSYFIALEEAARAQAPELVSLATRARERLHAAGRSLIEPYERALADLSPADRATLERVYPYRVHTDFHAQSKLSHPNFEAGLRAFPDDTQVLLRNNLPGASLTGFWSQADMRRIVDRMPGGAQLRAVSRRLHAWFRANRDDPKFPERLAALQARVDEKERFVSLLPRPLATAVRDLGKTYDQAERLVAQISTQFFASRFEVRGTAAEFERAMVDHYLHAQNIGIKPGTSYTTYPLLVARTVGGDGEAKLPFAELPGSRTFIVRLPRERGAVNGASQYVKQYEVTGFRGASPRRILQSYDPADPQWVLPVRSRGKPTVGVSPELQAFLDQWLNYSPPAKKPRSGP